MIKFLLVFYILTGVILANGVAIINGEEGIYLKLVNSEIEVNVESQVAVITSRQTFLNQFSKTSVPKYAFPLPADANATGLRWKVNGEWYEASFQAIPQDTTSPGTGGSMYEDLKSYLGDTPIYYDIEQGVKADSFLVVEISYVQLLHYEFGEVDFTYPNDYTKIQSSILDKQEINFNLISTRTIDNLSMNSSHDSITISNEGNSANLQSITFEKPASADYDIQYSLSPDELGLSGFSTMLPSGQIPDSYGRGFFVYIAEPDPRQRMPRPL
ncbi:MAG: VIT domain-containing protein [Calditrichaceae bacterium]